MYSMNVRVINKSGLHARPAFMFVQTASKFKSNIIVRKDDKTASSKSIINILALGISKDTEITISAEGEDEKDAVNALVKLVSQLEEA